MSRSRSWLARLWPATLTGQMVLLVVLALLLAMAINVWVLAKAHQKSLMVASERFLVRQFASLVLLLENTPQEIQEPVLRAWRRPGRDYGFSTTPVVEKPATGAALRFQENLIAALGEPYRQSVRVDLELAQRSHEESEEHEHHHDRERPPWKRKPRKAFEYLVISVQLSDGRWFYSKLVAPGLPPLAAFQTLSFLLSAAALVLLVVIWQLRRITRPLRDLQKAASDLGRGREVAQLPLRGPQDVQDTMSAFNTMNQRVNRFVSERTRMLAALSHDLRTPMTSMRLRLELMPDSEARDKLIASLDEMQQMAEATLAFVRQSGDREALQKVDMNALLESICDDFADMGAAVAFEEGAAQTLFCRPLSLKRALRNLVENGVNYGHSVRVSLSRDEDNLRIVIRDQGPGIPESQQEQVFDPFYRLEASRNRDTGGVGLGLSIARQIIHAHGGSIELHNRQPGLEVLVSLPLS